jgi:16S rRNA (uracil1498-N3)-methyltransferase
MTATLLDDGQFACLCPPDMHRFFVPPSSVEGDTVTLRGPVVHQIKNVLRLRVGDTIVVLDDSGWEYRVRLSALENHMVECAVESKTLAQTEPRTKVTLYQSLLKGDRLEWVLQKGTELGIVEFVPVVANRCVIGSVDDVSEDRLQRWQRIILEAAEQSRRGRLPRLHEPMLFAQACERARHTDLALMPWEGEKMRTLRSMLTFSPATPVTAQGKTSYIRRPFSISVFVGPEGSFTTREIDQARRYGILPVTLGPRILRAETAALVAATIILHHLENM